VTPLLGDAAQAQDLSDLFSAYVLTNITVVPAGTQLTALGVIPARTNIVQASTDFVTWIPISTNTVATNSFTVTDQTIAGVQTRFYRLLQLP
jgi:hypothetical protein